MPGFLAQRLNLTTQEAADGTLPQDPDEREEHLLLLEQLELLKRGGALLAPEPAGPPANPKLAPAPVRPPPFAGTLPAPLMAGGGQGGMLAAILAGLLETSMLLGPQTPNLTDSAPGSGPFGGGKLSGAPGGLSGGGGLGI